MSKDKSQKDMTFVLVHGTFQWGGQWRYVTEILENNGYPVYAPTLTGLGEREHLLSRQIGLSTHVEDISKYIEWYDLNNIILVGHSYGGQVITGIHYNHYHRIKHIVYVDTVPLNHGENLLDAFAFDDDFKSQLQGMVDEKGDGWLIPPEALREQEEGSLMRKHPWKCYNERINLTDGRLETPGTIIVATEDTEIFGAMREKSAPSRAKVRGWGEPIAVEGPHPLQEHEGSREKVANILLDIADKITLPPKPQY